MIIGALAAMALLWLTFIDWKEREIALPPVQKIVFCLKNCTVSERNIGSNSRTHPFGNGDSRARNSS